MTAEDQACYPYTTKILWTFRSVAVVLVCIFVIVNYAVGEMDGFTAGVFLVLSLALILGMFELVAGTHRRRGLETLRAGETTAGIVLSRRVLPMGPTHRLTIQYSLGGERFEGSVVVASAVYFQCEVGDKALVRALRSRPNRCVFLSPADGNVSQDDRRIFCRPQ